MLTTMLPRRPGIIVVAKSTHYGTRALTYANLTQARRRAAELGQGWSVYGTRPYYVGKPAN